MTDTLRALIAKWRQKAAETRGLYEVGRELPRLTVPMFSTDTINALRECADELEAALAAPRPVLTAAIFDLAQTTENKMTQANTRPQLRALVQDALWQAIALADAALAAEPQKNGGLTTSEIEAIVDNAFAEAAEGPDPWAGPNWVGKRLDE